MSAPYSPFVTEREAITLLANRWYLTEEMTQRRWRLELAFRLEQTYASPEESVFFSKQEPS